MALTDRPLYRAAALEPVLGYDDVALLIDQGGLVSKYDTAFYGVQGVRPLFGLGPHGVFLIWSQAAPPAGYTPAPAGMPTGNIAAGGTSAFAAPVGLNLGNYALVQVRWAVEVLALTGAVTLHDLDVQQAVGAVPDFGIAPFPSGRYNLQDQFQSPADAIVDPAQNANKGLPAAYPAAHPRDVANMTETYWFENNPPSWTVINNGGAAITGGSIGLRFWGFRYSLIPIKDDGSWQPRWLAGGMRQAPPSQRIVTIPTVPPAGTSVF